MRRKVFLTVSSVLGAFGLLRPAPAEAAKGQSTTQRLTALELQVAQLQATIQTMTMGEYRLMGLPYNGNGVAHVWNGKKWTRMDETIPNKL